jgi:hypothetical protein
MTRVTVAPDHGGNTLCPNCRTWGTHMFRPRRLVDRSGRCGWRIRLFWRAVPVRSPVCPCPLWRPGRAHGAWRHWNRCNGRSWRRRLHRPGPGLGCTHQWVVGRGFPACPPIGACLHALRARSLRRRAGRGVLMLSCGGSPASARACFRSIAGCGTYCRIHVSELVTERLRRGPGGPSQSAASGSIRRRRRACSAGFSVSSRARSSAARA